MESCLVPKSRVNIFEKNIMISNIFSQLIEACKSLLNETGDEVWEEEGSSWITMDSFIVFLV